ncbi:hypothetical protein HIM_06497 [Hirsutella minnesotensis 3608]|uniref:DNA2/NAM7 helicase helicase domain-containing protein n=1 Tax=Hirsutella minnesotensis 3608 TaxID=1043627 RepID=A0A0F7ZU10_9HYPO|nr:hypothetical protein HIM_06497 [Hirsutella minnesotensis 3608]
MRAGSQPLGGVMSAADALATSNEEILELSAAHWDDQCAVKDYLSDQDSSDLIDLRSDTEIEAQNEEDESLFDFPGHFTSWDGCLIAFNGSLLPGYANTVINKIGARPFDGLFAEFRLSMGRLFEPCVQLRLGTPRSQSAEDDAAFAFITLPLGEVLAPPVLQKVDACQQDELKGLLTVETTDLIDFEAPATWETLAISDLAFEPRQPASKASQPCNNVLRLDLRVPADRILIHHLPGYERESGAYKVDIAVVEPVRTALEALSGICEIGIWFRFRESFLNFWGPLLRKSRRIPSPYAILLSEVDGEHAKLTYELYQEPSPEARPRFPVEAVPFFITPAQRTVSLIGSVVEEQKMLQEHVITLAKTTLEIIVIRDTLSRWLPNASDRSKYGVTGDGQYRHWYFAVSITNNEVSKYFPDVGSKCKFSLAGIHFAPYPTPIDHLDDPDQPNTDSQPNEPMLWPARRIPLPKGTRAPIALFSVRTPRQQPWPSGFTAPPIRCKLPSCDVSGPLPSFFGDLSWQFSREYNGPPREILVKGRMSYDVDDKTAEFEAKAVTLMNQLPLDSMAREFWEYTQAFQGKLRCFDWFGRFPQLPLDIDSGLYQGEHREAAERLRDFPPYPFISGGPGSGKSTFAARLSHSAMSSAIGAKGGKVLWIAPQNKMNQDAIERQKLYSPDKRIARVFPWQLEVLALMGEKRPPPGPTTTSNRSNKEDRKMADHLNRFMEQSFKEKSPTEEVNSVSNIAQQIAARDLEYRDTLQELLSTKAARDKPSKEAEKKLRKICQKLLQEAVDSCDMICATPVAAAELAECYGIHLHIPLCIYTASSFL